MRKKKLAYLLRALILALEATGVICIGLGVWELYHPLGLIYAGGILIYLGVAIYGAVS